MTLNLKNESYVNMSHPNMEFDLRAIHKMDCEELCHWRNTSTYISPLLLKMRYRKKGIVVYVSKIRLSVNPVISNWLGIKTVTKPILQDHVYNFCKYYKKGFIRLLSNPIWKYTPLPHTTWTMAGTASRRSPPATQESILIQESLHLTRKYPFTWVKY